MKISQGYEFVEIDEQMWSWPTERIERAWEMLNLIRKFEEKSVIMYKDGLMGGSLHPYIGQEAVATGIGLALKPADYLTTTYRGRGHALAKGADPYRLFAEMLGRIDGYCKGKGGPMHIASKEVGILGANGIVAGGMPIAVGAALTSKYKKRDTVSVTYFGDGATNQGAFHESLNLAAVFKLPVVFICENNLYSEMTPIGDSVLNEHLAERGAAYRIPSLVVNGNDVRAVYEAGKLAIERARSGGGPTLIEAKTYRLLGHMYGDAEPYRSKDEVLEWWDREPLVFFQNLCLQKKLLSEARLKEIADGTQVRIDDAYSAALNSPEPGNEEIFTDVY